MKFTIRQPLSFILRGQRDNQEDSRWPDSDVIDAGQRFFMVCDGVGGSDMGELASATVTKSFATELARFNWSHDFANDVFVRVLDTAYNALDKVSGKDNIDMATTLTFAALHGHGLTLAHIGDSRIYHIRPSDGIIYRSNDHSLANNMVHKGMLSPLEAEDDLRRSIITRFMAPTDSDQRRSLATVLRTTDVQAGDYLLLCSDGVLNDLSDEDLFSIVCSERDDAAKMADIKARCMDSHDNSTAILIPIDHVEGLTSDPTEDNVEHAGSDADSAFNTVRVTKRTPGVTDVESMSRKPQGNCVVQFFKRLFHSR